MSPQSGRDWRTGRLQTRHLCLALVPYPSCPGEYAGLEQIMQELLGQTFAVASGKYRVVDVRRLNGETLVYAENLAAAGPRQALPVTSRRPQRTAFHYGDIAELLDPREP